MAMEAPCKKSAKGVLQTPSSSSTSCFITNLPIPILMEILCRLPIKTLAACKSACKLLLHLVRDPHFLQLYQTRAPTEVFFRNNDDEDDIMKLHMGNFRFLTKFAPLHVKLWKVSPDPGSGKLNNFLFEFPKFSVRANNTLIYRATKGIFVFANSCNGLLCYYGASIGNRSAVNRFAVVWNPCTSELITFPTPKIDITSCGYGLGFSRVASKFKLLRVMGRKVIGSSAKKEVVAEVCTIEKACSWKTVGPCSPQIMNAWSLKDKFHTIFLHGALHWVGFLSYSHNRYDIIIHTFDFEDDQFGRVPLPPPYVEDSRTLPQGTLGVLTDCLFMSDFRNNGLSIWLMKEYGVQDSWTKLFSLGFPLEKGLSYQGCLPISYMDNGELLMKCTYCYYSTIFVYNPDLQSVRVIGSVPYFIRVIAYRPSLIQLKDSMLGYDVHVMKPMRADLKRADPNWWRPVKEKSPQQHSSGEPLTNGTGGKSQISTSVMSTQETSAVELEHGQCSKIPVTTDKTCVSATRGYSGDQVKTINDHEHGQDLEERLRNELAKVEQLKQQNQQLEERLRDEQARVKQLEEQIQLSEQLKQQKQTNDCASHRRSLSW